MTWMTWARRSARTFDRMGKRRTGVSGPGVAGRKIVRSSTGRGDALRDIAERLMSDIFDFESGENIITDESDVRDSTRRIQLHFGSTQGLMA